jgi:hypothetical protein
VLPSHLEAGQYVLGCPPNFCPNGSGICCAMFLYTLQHSDVHMNVCSILMYHPAFDGTSAAPKYMCIWTHEDRCDNPHVDLQFSSVQMQQRRRQCMPHNVPASAQGGVGVCLARNHWTASSQRRTDFDSSNESRYMTARALLSVVRNTGNTDNTVSKYQLQQLLIFCYCKFRECLCQRKPSSATEKRGQHTADMEQRR